MVNSYRVVGIVDDVDSCTCCGRQGLKRTVALMDEDGNVDYFGTTCAGRVLGWHQTDKALGARIDRAVAAEKHATLVRITEFGRQIPERQYYRNWTVQLRVNPNVDRERAATKMSEFWLVVLDRIHTEFGAEIQRLGILASDIESWVR